jgi:asparagine synthase (glutamine-hydrolysing)
VKLMPGHMLDWRQGRFDISEFAVKSTPKPPATLDEAAAQLDHLLSEAVREQLVADTPLGVWLSGGLDSSSVLHYAAQHSPKVKSFSITFKGTAEDESEQIRRTAKHYGTDHTEFDLNPDSDLTAAIEEIAYYSDEPGADAGALPVWFLSKLTRQTATVALSGEGSDELFAGYLTYRADRYRARMLWIPRLLRCAALACATRLPAQAGRISFEYKLKRFLQGSLLSPEMAHVYWNGTHSESEKRELCSWAQTGAMERWLNEMDREPGLQRFLDFDQRFYLPDDILYKADRMSMAHSLEVRPPFLDPRIVDFAAVLPEQFKLQRNTSKCVLRRLMAGKLPDELLHRPKMGFDIPAHEWLRGPLREFLLATLNREDVEAAGLLRWPTVERLISRHLNRKENLGYQLWGLLVLTLWIKRWNIELPGAQPRSEEVLEDLELVSPSPQLALS